MNKEIRQNAVNKLLQAGDDTTKKHRTTRDIERLFKRMDDETVLKYNLLYNDYNMLRKEINSVFPNIASHVSRRFYYEVLGNKYNLSPNYICSIICAIQNNNSLFIKSLQRAKLNKIADES